MACFLTDYFKKLFHMKIDTVTCGNCKGQYFLMDTVLNVKTNSESKLETIFYLKMLMRGMRQKKSCFCPFNGMAHSISVHDSFVSCSYFI